MRFLFVLILVYIQYSAISQINQTIIVPLKTVGESEPFYPSQSPTRLSDSSLKFKGIPNGLKQYKIKELPLRQTTEKLYVLYGLNELGKRLILFDTNFDGDFSNEAPYLFDQDLHYDKLKAKAIEDTTRGVEIRLPNTPSILIKPIIYNCCMTYRNPLDSIWHLFVMTNYHREGKFSAGDQSYKIALSANNSPRFSMEQTSAFIAKSDGNFEKQSNQSKPYRFKSTIAVNNQLFFIDSLSRFGDTAWIVYKGYDANAQGNRVGLYATNIQTKTINNRSFDLSQLKGGYVLLDFWGTWCNPCIALIPRLKKLNDTYKAKGFTLVSIAVDKKSDYPKLLKMIEDKKLNWEHLYDDYEDVISSISKNKYDVDCFPTSVLIDTEGKIIFRGCGNDDFNKVEKLLSSKLK